MTADPRDAFPDLSPFFQPKGVALVGATGTPGKWGYFILHNFLAGGFPGTIHLVNPRGGTLFGRPALAAVEDLPEGSADLAMIVVPLPAVLPTLETLGRKGVRAVYVVTGGYSETGEEGARLEREIAATADRHGLLLAGPNGQGVLSTPARLCLQMSFARPVAGGLSMATQSGNMGATLMHLGEHTGIGFARLVSVGNSARLGVEEFLHWFARDDATRAVALYVEGVRDGARFLRVLRDAAARKPVVVLKGGRTAGGADAARSHTGALAGRADLFGRLCEQAGAVTVRTIEELFDVAAASSALRVPRGPRTGIVTVGGGWGVVAADAVEEHGLELAPLTPELRAELDTVLPDRWSRRNPVDMVGDIGPRAMSRCIDIVVRSGAYDAVLHLGGGLAGYAGRHVRSSPFFPDHLLGLFSEEGAKRDDRLGHALAELAEIPDCTLVFGADAAASPDAAENPGLRPIRDLGHPIYPSPERAVRALAALVRRGRIAGRLAAPPEDAEPVPADRIAEAARGIRNAADAGLAVLAEEAAATILERAGVPFAPFRTAADPDAAADAASRLGFPVVLKGAGPTLAHKSEDGLVRLDLASPRAVHDAAAELLERPGVERLLVARRIAARREFLAGVVRDPSFGPVAVVGLGGVLTEAIADVAYVRFPAPVGDLRDAIDGLRGRALFGPFRGEAPIDPAGLAAILRTLTALADAEPAVEAIDLNPLLADAAGRLTAVDALVTLRTPGS